MHVRNQLNTSLTRALIGVSKLPCLPCLVELLGTASVRDSVHPVQRVQVNQSEEFFFICIIRHSKGFPASISLPLSTQGEGGEKSWPRLLYIFFTSIFSEGEGGLREEVRGGSEGNWEGKGVWEGGNVGR